jgi:hypothetical protein
MNPKVSIIMWKDEMVMGNGLASRKKMNETSGLFTDL